MEQVTAVLNGKHILTPPRDIVEVKNVYKIYDLPDKFASYLVDDLFTAHGIITRGLVEKSATLRTRPVGMVDNKGHVLSFGALPQYVPELVMELLDRVEISDVHMLIRNCVFHYEQEVPLLLLLLGIGMWAACGIHRYFSNGILPFLGSPWSHHS